MKSIAFIIPYFGKFPNYFSLWLESCRNNPTIDWLLFTDCKTQYNYPENVKVNYITFAELKCKIQRLFDFEISLQKPYKLCDYKPAYGDIFIEELMGYDFWGYCDVDLIWGNLRHFLTEDILRNDRIGLNGHCTIIKNNAELRVLYKNKADGCPNYKRVFSSSISYCFDEGNAFNKYFPKYGYRLAAIPNVFDVRIKHKGFLPTKKILNGVAALSTFIYDKGELKCYYLDGVKEVSNEVSYVHLQKRDMIMKIPEESSQYTIVPNSFTAYGTKRNWAYNEKLGGIRIWYVKYLVKFWIKDVMGVHRFYHYKYPWLYKK